MNENKPFISPFDPMFEMSPEDIAQVFELGKKEDKQEESDVTNHAVPIDSNIVSLSDETYSDNGNREGESTGTNTNNIGHTNHTNSVELDDRLTLRKHLLIHQALILVFLIQRKLNRLEDDSAFMSAMHYTERSAVLEDIRDDALRLFDEVIKSDDVDDISIVQDIFLKLNTDYLPKI